MTGHTESYHEDERSSGWNYATYHEEIFCSVSGASGIWPFREASSFQAALSLSSPAQSQYNRFDFKTKRP